MFGFKKEDGVSWTVLAIIIMILYFVFSDGKFSIIFTLAGTVQTFGFALIALKIRRSRSVTGLSRETFLCYTIIFSIRAILFMIYKVQITPFRAICQMTPLVTSYSEYKNSQLLYSQATFSTAFQLHTKSATINNLTLSNHIIS